MAHMSWLPPSAKGEVNGCGLAESICAFTLLSQIKQSFMRRSGLIV